MTTDRRVRRSKKVIENTMIKLLKTQRINQITVKKLCEISDVNRGTFYHHYLDIYDLINQIENQLIAELKQRLAKYSPDQINHDALPLFKEIVQFIDEKANTVMVLFKGKEGDLFLKKIVNLVKTIASQNWGKLYHRLNSQNYDYFLEYAIFGCLGIINRWLHEGRKEPPNDLAKLLEEMVIHGVKTNS
ncbi:MAG: TetR/AcrR family transcriptional regulator [Bacilli bacterium]